MVLKDISVGVLLARRARYISISIWCIVMVIGLALLAAEFSARQPSTVAVDVGFSAIRILLPVIIILLVQELSSHEFDRRYYLTSLTYPRPRHQFLLGRIATVLMLIYSLLIVTGFILSLIAIYIYQGYQQATPVDIGAAYWVTLGFIAVDLFVLTSIAVFLSIVASTPSFVLIGTLGFMLIARSYSGIIALLERNRYVVDNSDTYRQSLNFLHYIFPDLGNMDVRMISLYSEWQLLPENWANNLLLSLLYAIIFFSLSFMVLNRKRFN